MLVSVAEVQAEMNDLFNQRARLIAKQTGFCERQRELTGPVFAKALVFGLMLKADSTLEDLQDFASEHLGVDVTAKAFGGRFGEASAEFLGALLGEALGRCFTARASLLPVLRRFNGVYLRDACTVSLPACLAGAFAARAAGNGKPAAAVKVVLEMELATGQFTELQVIPALDNDKASEVAAKPLPEGALLLEDVGFLCGDRLQGYAEQGVYFLTRVPHWTAIFLKRRFGKGYERLNVLAWLRQAKGSTLSRRVYVFHEQKLSLRLLAVRVPAEVAEARREQVRKDAKSRGRELSQRKLDLCDWNVLLTNAPQGLISAGEGWELRRVRWQVELTFKVFKSVGGLQETQARGRWRVLSELYARLLGLLVQRWVQLAAGFVALAHSAIRAAQKVRKRACSLLAALHSERAFRRQVEGLARQFDGCLIQQRHDRLCTFDRLAALDAEFRQLVLAA
jgi:Transposase DDE domain